MFSLKDIVKEISKSSGLSDQEVKKKVEEKQTELSGLVSPEGAAYIVGRELGVNLLKEAKRRALKIENVIPGMRSVDIIGKVVEISEKRDFEKRGRSGSVVNVTLGDETGSLRFSLWNDEIKLLEKLEVKPGDVLKITGGYVKENRMGGSEVSLGKGGILEKTDAVIEGVKEKVERDFVVMEKSVNELEEGDYGEIRASLVQVFRRNPFFDVCPKCESKVKNEGGVFKCNEHGNVEPKHNLVISGVVDDGSGNIRVVFFRDIAERVLGKCIADLEKLSSEDPMKIYDDLKLGEEFIIRGRVKKNQFTESIELVANDVERVSPKREAERLLTRIKEIKN